VDSPGRSSRAGARSRVHGTRSTAHVRPFGVASRARQGEECDCLERRRNYLSPNSHRLELFQGLLRRRDLVRVLRIEKGRHLLVASGREEDRPLERPVGFLDQDVEDVRGGDGGGRQVRDSAREAVGSGPRFSSLVHSSSAENRTLCRYRAQGSEPERTKTRCAATGFGPSRLGDLNPGPTHYGSSVTSSKCPRTIDYQCYSLSLSATL
jgi:hypothetical protein